MLVLQLWCVIFGITIPYKAFSSPVSSTSSSRLPVEVRNSNEFKEAERALLKSMGIKTRPRNRKGTQIPQHMQDLYNSHEQHPDWISTKFRFNKMWTSANTVRSFYHQDDLSHSDTSRPTLRFDLSTFPQHEKVESAELRLYKSEAWRSTNESAIRVSIYLMADPLLSDVSRRLIDSRTVNIASSGWETFDVRTALEHWISYPSNNYGIEVRLTTKEGRSLNISANDIIRNTSIDANQWHEQRPLLVAYTHDDKTHHHVRKKRSILSNRGHRKRKRPQYCQRHPLYVDFSDVGWNDWIVAPPGYYAFYCNGECPYPITKHLNATNHAIVQTVMNSVDPKVPNVCCVPTTLSPISMLYLDEFEKVVLKNYQDMVVQGCGCR